jgi:glutathione S-transferase
MKGLVSARQWKENKPMSAQIDFYTNPQSRGAIARWMIEETGVEYREIVLPFGKPMKDAAYRAINPMGKVPAIVHAGHIVTEVAAICLYLADVFREAGLHPEPDEKADYYRWILFAAGPVEQAVVANTLKWETPPERRGMVGFGNYDLVIDTLDALFSGREHVCGKRFTAADVYVGSHINWGLMFGSIPRRPAFEEYVARITARPAFKAARAKDAALIAQAQSTA